LYCIHVSVVRSTDSGGGVGYVPSLLPYMWKVSFPTREKNGKYDKLKEDPRLEIIKKELEGEELDESWNVGLELFIKRQLFSQ
jgi:hypothetical protein